MHALLLALALAASQTPRTFRVDAFHTGNATEERFALDRLVLEPLPFPGNPDRPVDDLNLGKYLFEVRDLATNRLLYSRGYATVFGEWETTAEAKEAGIEGTVILTSRTYNQLPSGTYGQSVPAIPRTGAIGFSQDARLIGLSHDPTLAAGYRTNLGFVNASPAPIRVEAEFYFATGVFLGKMSYDLLPYDFFQKDKAFEDVTSDPVSDGYIIVRTTTAGAKFFAYAVVTDNITGDPTYVDALIPE